MSSRDKAFISLILAIMFSIASASCHEQGRNSYEALLGLWSILFLIRAIIIQLRTYGV
jgi:hypothetical protein